MFIIITILFPTFHSFHALILHCSWLKISVKSKGFPMTCVVGLRRFAWHFVQQFQGWRSLAHLHTWLRRLGPGPSCTNNFCTKKTYMECIIPFFPRASERRVLPIVGACKTSSHLHISSSHLLIFTSYHLHIFFSSSHLIITSSHLHIFSSSHLLIFTSSHLHIFSPSHLHTSSHLHIFSSSHLLTSSHLHIFSSSHFITSSHLHIFSYLLTSSHIFSHLLTSSHIFSHLLTSSHIFSHLLTSSHIFSHLTPLALLPSCLLALSFFSISLLKAGVGAVATRRHETQPFRTKWGSIVKN